MTARTFALALVLLLGCAKATPGATSPESSSAANEGEAAARSDELVSVRPEVNDKYLLPDAVETWTANLERERREVIAKRDAIVAALELGPGMVVADIGAGTGAFMEALSGAVGERGTVYAVDIIPAFVTHLRERAASGGLANVVVIEGSPTATNLPERSVDLLFTCDVYHHIEYPSVYLRSLHRTLRDDGRLVIVEFDKVPGKTSAAMMKHVRQDKATLLAEVLAEGFVLEREIETIEFEENYMLVFHK